MLTLPPGWWHWRRTGRRGRPVAGYAGV